MTYSIYGLVLMFVVLTGLLVSLNLRSNWPWGIKAIVIIATLYFWIACYTSLSTFSGAPVENVKIPENSQFLWSQEIVPTRDDEGAIYIWAIPDGSDVPHTYKFDYSEQLHRQLIRQKERICSGERLFMKGKGRIGEYPPGGVPSHHEGFEFETPDDLLPPKNNSSS